MRSSSRMPSENSRTDTLMSIFTPTVLHSDDALQPATSTAAPPKILFIGANLGDFASLQTFLEKRNCQCSFASSAGEASALFGPDRFDVILDRTPFQSEHPVLAALGVRNCSIFRCCQVEIGALWLPVIVRGKKCFGSAAVRPKDFVRLLEDTISQIVAQPEHRRKAVCQ